MPHHPHSRACRPHIYSKAAVSFSLNPFPLFLPLLALTKSLSSFFCRHLCLRDEGAQAPRHREAQTHLSARWTNLLSFFTNDNLTDFRYCYHVVPQVKVHLVTYVYLKWKIPVPLLSRTTSQLQSALSLKDYKVLSAAYKEQGLEKTLMKAHGINKH